MTKLAVIALALFACSKEDYKNQKPPEPEMKTEPPPKQPPPKPRQDLKPEEMGSCDLEATGAVKAKQTTYGGIKATNITYWQTDKEKSTMSNIEGFVVNCHGPDIKFSIMPGGGKKDGQTFAPKKYTFKNGTGDAGVMVSFGAKDKNDPVGLTLDKVNGTVDITAFDKKHIAGTVDLSGKLVGKGAAGGAVKVTGKFDFLCPGFGGCE
jgi:hypothetical protein